MPTAVPCRRAASLAPGSLPRPQRPAATRGRSVRPLRASRPVSPTPQPLRAALPRPTGATGGWPPAAVGATVHRAAAVAATGRRANPSGEPLAAAAPRDVRAAAHRAQLPRTRRAHPHWPSRPGPSRPYRRHRLARGPPRHGRRRQPHIVRRAERRHAQARQPVRNGRRGRRERRPKRQRRRVAAAPVLEAARLSTARGGEGARGEVGPTQHSAHTHMETGAARHRSERGDSRYGRGWVSSTPVTRGSARAAKSGSVGSGGATWCGDKHARRGEKAQRQNVQ